MVQKSILFSLYQIVLDFFENLGLFRKFTIYCTNIPSCKWANNFLQSINNFIIIGLFSSFLDGFEFFEKFQTFKRLII